MIRYSYLLVLIVISILLMGCIDRSRKSKDGISYDTLRNVLRITYLKDYESISDSFFNKTYSSVLIESSDFVEYQKLFDKIKPDSLRSIKISNFYGEQFDLDLTRFKGLKSLQIIGRRIQRVRVNLDSYLEFLLIISPRLEFPYESEELYKLETLIYEGISDTIPKWIEKLDSLKFLTFKTKSIVAIEPNVCIMNGIEVFDISMSDLYLSEKEFYIKNNKFNKLRNIRLCKPDIQFEQLNPPM